MSQESLGGTGGNREAGGGEAVVGPLVGDERWGVPCIKVGSEGKDGRGVVVGGESRVVLSYLALTRVPVDPVADLGIFERCYPHCHVVILLHPVSIYIHPLVTRENPNDLPRPLLLSWLFEADVDPRATGARFGIAVLVQQIIGLLRDRAEPIHQVARTVIVKAREVNPPGRKLLDRGDNTQIHVLDFWGSLQLQNGIVIIRCQSVRHTFEPALRHLGLLDPGPPK